MAQGQPQIMIVRWATAGLALLFSHGVALPDDLTGQASIVDGDTWKFTVHAFACGVSMHPRAASFVEAKTVSNTGAAHGRRMTWTRSSPVAR